VRGGRDRGQERRPVGQRGVLVGPQPAAGGVFGDPEPSPVPRPRAEPPEDPSVRTETLHDVIEAADTLPESAEMVAVQQVDVPRLAGLYEQVRYLWSPEVRVREGDGTAGSEIEIAVVQGVRVERAEEVRGEQGPVGLNLKPDDGLAE